jgi:hypothetical protein
MTATQRWAAIDNFEQQARAAGGQPGPECNGVTQWNVRGVSFFVDRDRATAGVYRGAYRDGATDITDLYA